MDFFEHLLSLYSTIQFPEDYQELAKIDKAISWYLADQSNQYITANESNNTFIAEIDIKNAFYTICNNWFDPESDFLIELNKLTDKKARNIFIATSLKDTPYLKQLNIICKIIVMGILFETGNAQLLELKKDGAVILCERQQLELLKNLNELTNHKFINFIAEKFTLKVNLYKTYIRSHRTSYFWNGTDLIIKGVYKYIPSELETAQKSILKNENIDLKNLKKIYSTDYFKIIVTNNLDQILENYYLCSNKKYLQADYKYYHKLILDKINPNLYLKTFIYPILLANRLQS